MGSETFPDAAFRLCYSYSPSEMNQIWQIICLTIAILWWLPQNLSQGMGPFQIDFKGFGLCPNVKLKNPAVYNTKYTKVGRKKSAISFDVYAKYPINDDIMFRTDVALKTQNGFKANYFHLEGPMVTTIKNYAPEYYRLMKFPIPPGNYSIRNLTIVEPQHALVQTFFYNTYKLVIKLSMKNELLSCIESLVQTVPKRNP